MIEDSRERARFSSEFISALLRDFRQGGPAAIAKVRKYQPAAYMKICALLVPREMMKVETSATLKAMSDEQLEAAIAAVRDAIDRRAAEGAIDVTPPKRKPNRLMMEADTAIGVRERKRRKRVPSPMDA